MSYLATREFTQIMLNLFMFGALICLLSLSIYVMVVLFREILKKQE